VREYGGDGTVIGGATVDQFDAAKVIVTKFLMRRTSFSKIPCRRPHFLV
jgi:hypothetical protein